MKISIKPNFLESLVKAKLIALSWKTGLVAICNVA